MRVIAHNFRTVWTCCLRFFQYENVLRGHFTLDILGP